MMQRFMRMAAVTGVLSFTLLTCIWLFRATESRSLAALQIWHTYRPAEEFRARNFPDGMSFADYRALEGRLATELAENVVARTDPQTAGILNRFNAASVVHVGLDPDGWNWSKELPQKDPNGAVLLLHGASDSPYSMRALAELFAAANLHVLVLRLPGNGTVPGGLADVELADWAAVARMGVAHLDNITGGDRPVYVAGYSVGAALALDYTLTAIGETESRVPDALFLYSPAIAVSQYARYASWDVTLGAIPAFNKFAWISIQPEYDPYKYNSFPKSAGDVSWRLTRALEQRMLKLAASANEDRMPPVIAFQSVVDATVSPAALVDIVFDHLPDNGSELVLFDLNRRDVLRHLVTDPRSAMIRNLQEGPALDFSLTLVSNRTAQTHAVVATTRPAGFSEGQVVDLALEWPVGVYSLSHVAIPFSADDPWYGIAAPGRGSDALAFDTVAPRGEKDILLADINNLMRLRYNPFFPYVADRTLQFCMACERVAD